VDDEMKRGKKWYEHTIGWWRYALTDASEGGSGKLDVVVFFFGIAMALGFVFYHHSAPHLFHLFLLHNISPEGAKTGACAPHPRLIVFTRHSLFPLFDQYLGGEKNYTCMMDGEERFGTRY
jgi:hypothetical protein